MKVIFKFLKVIGLVVLGLVELAVLFSACYYLLFK